MQALHRATMLSVAVALLIGPQWCCCSLRLLAAAQPSAPGVCGCSCCCGGPASPAADERHEGDPVGHRCPCRDKPRQMAAATVHAKELSLTPVGPVLAGITDPASPREAGAVERVRSLGRPPAAGGRLLLSMLGILRC